MSTAKLLNHTASTSRPRGPTTGRRQAPIHPYQDRSVRATGRGRICTGRRDINLSTMFVGQNVGFREIEDQIWQVRFSEYDLGYFDAETVRLEPIKNPIRSNGLSM